MTSMRGSLLTIQLYWHKNAAQTLAKSLMGTQLLSLFLARPLPDEQITRPMNGNWTWWWLWHSRVQIWLRQAVGQNYNTSSLPPSSCFVGWLFSHHPEKSVLWMTAISSVTSCSSFNPPTALSTSFLSSVSSHLKQVCREQLHTNGDSLHVLSLYSTICTISDMSVACN